ncbi:Hypothetical predicted protein [Olea europaea subsp. europaea]|uniref:Uncharacterized protein n=1 Tax=Olea europaea subsp. europaea TaxID=158383 RepID=A0A8S0RML2_OLEEU|nr:Hypothetical predicted protein [Olea europaea subsp. europaea]
MKVPLLLDLKAYCEEGQEGKESEGSTQAKDASLVLFCFHNDMYNFDKDDIIVLRISIWLSITNTDLGLEFD